MKANGQSYRRSLDGPFDPLMRRGIDPAGIVDEAAALRNKNANKLAVGRQRNAGGNPFDNLQLQFRTQPACKCLAAGDVFILHVWSIAAQRRPPRTGLRIISELDCPDFYKLSLLKKCNEMERQDEKKNARFGSSRQPSACKCQFSLFKLVDNAGISQALQQKTGKLKK